MASDNIWQRFQGMLESKLDEHHISGHARHYLLPILWTAKALAAEDAEREGREDFCNTQQENANDEWRSLGTESRREDAAVLRVPAPAGASASGEQADRRAGRADGGNAAARPGDDSRSAEAARSEGLLRSGEAVGDESSGRSSAPPAGSLPPLDAALVEECESAAWQYGVCNRQALMAALTHYRERVEGPLREELATEKAGRERAWLENTRLRVERKANRAEADRFRRMYEEREHNVGETGRLRAELADVKDQQVAEDSIEIIPWELDDGELGIAFRRANGQFIARAAKMLGSIRERLKAQPAPATDEERQRLADMARYYGGQGASSLVYVRADDMRRIATLLEQPAPAKSIGRRWASLNPDGSIEYTAPEPQHEQREVLCDLVPVAEEEKP